MDHQCLLSAAQELVKFAKTAPGRLPERVQLAIQAVLSESPSNFQDDKDCQILAMQVDELDAAAIHEAVAKRQAWRINNECILPEGNSDLRGACLAEICRDWLEYKERVRVNSQ